MHASRILLEFEKVAPERHEYTAGDVYLMPDVSLRHNRTVGNVLLRLHASAKGGKCHVYFSALKLRAADDAIYYPDVIVVCEDNPDMDTEIVRDPCLIVEVTSPGTGRVDRVEKLSAYRSIASLDAIYEGLAPLTVRELEAIWYSA